eukprot:10418183-Alexandrium_andersonii.AAC.1
MPQPAAPAGHAGRFLAVGLRGLRHRGCIALARCNCVACWRCGCIAAVALRASWVGGVAAS